MQRQYLAEATVFDPRTDGGMKFGATQKIFFASRHEAVLQARKWAREGYWAAVYFTATGEMFEDFTPTGYAL